MQQQHKSASYTELREQSRTHTIQGKARTKVQVQTVVQVCKLHYRCKLPYSRKLVQVQTASTKNERKVQ